MSLIHFHPIVINFVGLSAPIVSVKFTAIHGNFFSYSELRRIEAITNFRVESDLFKKLTYLIIKSTVTRRVVAKNTLISFTEGWDPPKMECPVYDKNLYLVLIDLVGFLRHTNHCRLFNAKSCSYKTIYVICKYIL